MTALRCMLGFHDYRWHVTMRTREHRRQYEWEQCERCGKVNPDHIDEYRAYHNPDYES